MEHLVLDTDVISFIAKGDTRAALYSPLLEGKQLSLCFQTVAEQRLWAILHKWGPSRRNALDATLSEFIVIPYDPMMAERWAELTAHRREAGRPIEAGDAWIAASAIRHNATLLSHNSKHYQGIPGLNLISYGSKP
jgi:tRNA(fMet)-specific endonuclease VapC